MKFQARIVPAILLILILIACDGGTLLKGVVKDSSGVPIEGAKVTLVEVSANRSRTMETGSDGRYTVGMTHAPSAVTLKLIVEKEGYTRFEKQFSSHDHLKDVPVTLLRVAH